MRMRDTTAAVLEAVDIYAVMVVGDPWYTSGVHI
jgi:hypothetical protein